jgi:hypothetical protein
MLYVLGFNFSCYKINYYLNFLIIVKYVNPVGFILFFLLRVECFLFCLIVNFFPKTVVTLEELDGLMAKASALKG